MRISLLLPSSLVFVTSTAFAQEGGFDAQPLDLAAPGDRFQTVPDASAIIGDLHPHLSFNTNYSFSSSWGDVSGLSIPSLQLYGHLSGSMAFLGRGHLDFNIPLQYSTENGVLMGDSTIRLKSLLVGNARSKVAMAIDVGAWIPSGDPTQFTGESEARYMGRAIFSGDAGKVFYAANLGYYHRAHNVVSDSYEIGPSVVFGLATGFDVWDDKVYLGPEISGYTMLPQDGSDTGLFSMKSSPIEGMLSVQYRTDSMIIDTSFGRGITTTPGTPDFRGGIEVTAITKILPDEDRDGIVNKEDVCPHIYGEYSFNPKVNGCPDADGDGLMDALDDCPGIYVEKLEGASKTGCPDSDEDGFIDSLDNCPAEKGLDNEDPFLVGCPNTDVDDDGVANEVDACPSEAGIASADPLFNGCPDSDGDGVFDKVDSCPEAVGGQHTRLQINGCPAPQFTGEIHFLSGTATLKQSAISELQRIAALIKEYPEYEHIIIEGHTDTEGPSSYNQSLSEERAKTVQQWLIDEGGIEANRLYAFGYGEEFPLNEEKTQEEKEDNRRVMFQLVDKQPEAKPQTPVTLASPVGNESDGEKQQSAKVATQQVQQSEEKEDLTVPQTATTPEAGAQPPVTESDNSEQPSVAQEEPVQTQATPVVEKPEAETNSAPETTEDAAQTDNTTATPDKTSAESTAPVVESAESSGEKEAVSEQPVVAEPATAPEQKPAPSQDDDVKTAEPTTVVDAVQALDVMKMKKTEIESFDKVFAKIEKVQETLRSASAKLDSANDHLGKALGITDIENLEAALMDFQKKAPGMIKVRPKLDTIPPMLGFQVSPDAPPQIKNAVKELDLASKDIQSISTDVFRLRSTVVGLLGEAYGLPSEAFKEGKQLLSQGFSGIPKIIFLSSNLRHNIMVTKNTTEDAANLFVSSKNILHTFATVFPKAKALAQNSGRLADNLKEMTKLDSQLNSLKSALEKQASNPKSLSKLEKALLANQQSLGLDVAKINALQAEMKKSTALKQKIVAQKESVTKYLASAAKLEKQLKDNPMVAAVEKFQALEAEVAALQTQKAAAETALAERKGREKREAEKQLAALEVTLQEKITAVGAQDKGKMEAEAKAIQAKAAELVAVQSKLLTAQTGVEALSLEVEQVAVSIAGKQETLQGVSALVTKTEQESVPGQPKVKETGVESFDSFFADVQAIQGPLLAANDKLKSANAHLKKALNITRPSQLQQAFADFKAKAPDMIDVKPDLTTMPPRLLVTVKPEAPTEVKTTVAELNAALNDIQAIQTDVLALKKSGTKLLAKSYTIPAQSIDEGKKLISQGFSGAMKAFTLGGKVKHNIKITQNSGELATNILKDTRTTIEALKGTTSK